MAEWPTSLRGYRIGLVADSHIRDKESVDLTRNALTFLVAEQPDMIVFSGDLVSYWKAGVEDMVLEALEPLLDFDGPSLAVPGNHDYYGGDADFLYPMFSPFGTRLLRNELWNHAGINWVGVDSACENNCDPFSSLENVDPNQPTIILWHEPDMVDVLSPGPNLMLSGHSHGGQFTTPWGWAPMTATLGKKYLRGYYPNAPVPLYVSRGIGTTGPPARLFCPAEVTLITLV